jgi:hypothetical protein
LPSISPELALVDPELARFARSLLPEIDLDAPVRRTPPVHRATPIAAVPPPVAAPSPASDVRRWTTRHRAGLVLAAAIAVGAPAALAVTTRSGGDGTAGHETGSQAARPPAHALPPAASARAAHTAAKPDAVAPKSAVGKTVHPKILKKPTPRRTGSPTAPAANHVARPPRTPFRPPRHATAPRSTRARTTRPTVRAAPLLRWPSSPAAPFFDVVLWRDGRRLLDSWPSVPRLQVPTSWTYDGHGYTLDPGTYLWFVYPGIGSRLSARYGPLLASGRFTIAAPATG